jgi:hypothetical protein
MFIHKFTGSTIEANVIHGFVSTLTSGAIFLDLKNLIKDVEETSLTSEEKKAKVLADFKHIGYDMADIVIKISIDLVVYYLNLIAKGSNA